MKLTSCLVNSVILKNYSLKIINTVFKAYLFEKLILPNMEESKLNRDGKHKIRMKLIEDQNLFKEMQQKH